MRHYVAAPRRIKSARRIFLFARGKNSFTGQKSSFQLNLPNQALWRIRTYLLMQILLTFVLC